MTNRKLRRAQAAKKPPVASQTPADLDTVYDVKLTGRDIDGIGNVLDQVVRASGIQGAAVVLPLLEKITAPRRAAMAEVA